MLTKGSLVSDYKKRGFEVKLSATPDGIPLILIAWEMDVNSEDLRQLENAIADLSIPSDKVEEFLVQGTVTPPPREEKKEGTAASEPFVFKP